MSNLPDYDHNDKTYILSLSASLCRNNTQIIIIVNCGILFSVLSQWSLLTTS